MAEQEDAANGTTRRVTVSLSVPVPEPDLFRHKATDDVLRLLVEHPYETFTIRELARLLDIPAQSVKRAVDVLEANELIVVDNEGNRRLTGINRSRVSEPDDPVLRIPQPEFHRPVREALDRLRDELDDIRGVLVFGSVARGEADRQSDIDLWVLSGADRGAQHRANELAKELGTERFDGDRYEFQILTESPSTARGHGDRLEDVFVDSITLVDGESLRQLQQEVMGDA